MFHDGEQMRFLSAEIDAVLDSTTRPGAVGLGYQLISDPRSTHGNTRTNDAFSI